MAKKHEVATLSKMNKDLSLLIDEDLQKESELLRKLIREVYEANQKVKESHLRRVQETSDKLKHLNREIDTLKKDIETQDQTTTLEQFNFLLKSKDQIFDAMNSMRLFDNEFLIKHPLTTHLSFLKERIKKALIVQSNQNETISSHFVKPMADYLVNWVEQLFDQAESTFTIYQADSEIYTKISDKYKTQAKKLVTFTADFGKQVADLEKERTHFFYGSVDENFFSEKIDKMYDKAVGRIEQKMKDSQEDYAEKIKKFDEELHTLEKDTLEEFKQKYAKRLTEEQQLKATLNDRLKQLRFEIMTAEKSNDAKKLDGLLKEYDKTEKQNLNLYEEKVKRLASQKTKNAREKLLKSKKNLELKHETDKHKLNVQLETEKLKFKESSALFKIREDQKSLENDLKINENITTNLKHIYQGLADYKDAVYTFVEDIESLCIVHSTQFYKAMIDQTSHFEDLYQNFKDLELRLTKLLNDKTYDEKHFDVKLQEAFEETTLNIAHQQNLQRLLKQKVDEEKTSEVDEIKAQEDANNELIYQNTRIEIAEKEYELQLIKIRSLYDNEVDLTKSQAERLNIGMGVNESMVKTTVESQMLFAQQQIKFAEKEYEARIENIQRTQTQELEYAQAKLKRIEVPYASEHKTIVEERDNKLEDLSYRIALFVEEKDRKKLEEQEAKLKATYQEKLNALEAKRSSDPQIQRYEKQIEAANKRAETAINDAESLKEKTINTFKDLLEQSEEKLQRFKERSDDEVVPKIETESEVTAKSRLDEALDEAKEQLEEKLKEPKQRIDELNTLLASQSDDASVDTSEYDKNIEALHQKHFDDLNRLNDDTSKAITALNTDQAQKDIQLEEAKEKIGSFKLDIHKTQMMSQLLRSMKQDLIEFKASMSQYYRDNQQSLKQQLKSLDQKTISVNKHLHSAITAYKRYLKTTSSNQAPKLKQIQKKADEELKTKKAEIEARY